MFNRSLFFAVLLASAGSVLLAAENPVQPDGLNATDWREIQTKIRAHRATSDFNTAQGKRPQIATSPRSGSAPRFAQQAYLKAGNTEEEDYFGDSVAVSGDTVVVGSRGEDSSAIGIDGDSTDNGQIDSGAVFVFVRSADGWTQQAYLKASNTDDGDWFGSSVAVSGDTIVVGAPLEDSNSTEIDTGQDDNSFNNSGAAYVFVRDNGNWAQQAYLKPSNNSNAVQFGLSVAVSGGTAVVGAWRANASLDETRGFISRSGAAYVFERTDTTWSEQAILIASNADTNDRFGIAVAVDDDMILVGAPGEDSDAEGVNGVQDNNSAEESGAAYVFVRQAGMWLQQSYLKASNTGADDEFGSSVAVSGNTILIGAYAEASNATGIDGDQADNSAERSGAAYIFVQSEGNWTQQAYVKASNTGRTDFFGFSVGISDDTAVVGAFFEDSAATGIDGEQDTDSAASSASGAAYIFVRDGELWRQRAYVKASNTQINDRFGDAVAVAGNTVIVGGWLEDSSATGVGGDQLDNTSVDSGAVYVFIVDSIFADRFQASFD